jgi:hypothetical protein
VTTPLVVSKREDGTLNLLQGFRRLNAVRWIRKNEPETPLAKELEKLSVNVYHRLTEEQEKAIVNDQTSKSFSSAEVLQRLFEEWDGGYHWFTSAERNYQLIARVTSSDDIVRRIVWTSMDEQYG